MLYARRVTLYVLRLKRLSFQKLANILPPALAQRFFVYDKARHDILDSSTHRFEQHHLLGAGPLLGLTD
jgi:hypothetical protein